VAARLGRQSLGGYRVIGLGPFLVEEALGLGAVAPGEVCRLDEGPGEVRVPVLGVAFSLLLAIGHAYAIDAARIGSKVPHLAETLDRPGFKQNGRRKRLANARYAGEQPQQREAGLGVPRKEVPLLIQISPSTPTIRKSYTDQCYDYEIYVLSPMRWLPRPVSFCKRKTTDSVNDYEKDRP
jgi:hypothetical protein